MIRAGEPFGGLPGDTLVFPYRSNDFTIEIQHSEFES